MNNLLKLCPIKKESLDNGHYLQSLLQEACLLKLLTDAELEKIQLQTIQLLAEQTERYTRGESSSVKVETAQSLLLSAYYSISVYLKSLPDTDCCLEELKSRPLSEMLLYGNKIIEQQIHKTKRLFNAAKANCVDTENTAYNDTLKGLSVFFTSYNMHFDAHNSPASIDYPLSNDKMDLAGVEYIYTYLQKLFYENQFCRKFSADYIHYVLRGYSENYKDLLLNIFEHVLLNALGCVLMNKNVFALNIEPRERDLLQTKLENRTENELNSLLHSTSEKLCTELDISNAFLREHMAEAAGSFVPELKRALALHKLEPLFVSFKGERARIRFEDGKTLDDELFAKVAQGIKDCCTAEEKAAVIREEIHSLIDLTDILDCGYIYDDEFAVIFRSLQDRELALLLKKLPSYGLNTDFAYTGDEKEWEINLTVFFNGMEPERRNRIKETAEKIKLN